MNTHVHAASNAPNLGMQVTTFENPMGIDGFEFVEFAAPAGQAAGLHDYFRNMGFTAVLRHRQRAITVYRQGGVNFLVNEEPDSFAADFAAKHGPCACGFAIRFQKPAAEVLSAVLVHKLHERKAKPGMRADFTGLDIPDRFLFGCGMDYKGYWRNAPGIYAVKGL